VSVWVMARAIAVAAADEHSGLCQLKDGRVYMGARGAHATWAARARVA
jgi:hypothetical protein